MGVERSPRREIEAVATAIHIELFEQAGIDFRVTGSAHAIGTATEAQLGKLALVGAHPVKAQTCALGGIGKIRQAARIHPHDIALHAEVLDNAAADGIGIFSYQNGRKILTAHAQFGAVVRFKNAMWVCIASPAFTREAQGGCVHYHGLLNIVFTIGQQHKAAMGAMLIQLLLDRRGAIGRMYIRK